MVTLADEIIPKLFKAEDLAEAIYNNASDEDKARWKRGEFRAGEFDELNIPYPGVGHDTIDYLVCRILLRNKDKFYYSRKDDKIHDIETHYAIEPTQKLLVQLSGRASPLYKDTGYVLVWERLKKFLPELSERIVQVSPYLYLDMETQELFSVETEQERTFVRWHDRKWSSQEELESFDPLSGMSITRREE